MAITDPRAILFANEVLRPLSERYRALFEDVARAKAKWTDEVQALCPNDVNEILVDGRAAEGVSQLTGQEIAAIVAVFTQTLNLRAGTAVTNLANVDTRLAKACVRTLDR